MYKRIMVPLDGSALAECVFPHVEAFVKAFNVSDVYLVRVVESDPTFEHLSNLPDLKKKVLEYEESKKSSENKYLNEISNRFKHEGTTVHSKVLSAARITEGLVLYAEKSSVDLIVIATHGRSGISRWVMGSVADKLLRSASVPVFMVRSQGAGCPT